MVVSEIESARDVLASLNDADATIHPETFEVHDTRGDVRIDLGRVTAKQWEALELAHDRGYYDRPRDADLSELATELSISKSAVSQRLRAAEATIIDAVIDATR